MKGLDDDINERVSFLKEQINPQNKPLVNKGFCNPVETLRNADTDKVAIQILQKQKQLENAKDTASIERIVVGSNSIKAKYTDKLKNFLSASACYV